MFSHTVEKMSKKEKSTLFTFGSLGAATVGGVLFLLSYGLPYWVDYKDDVTVNGASVNLRYTYGFWRYCNKQESANGTVEVCASVDEHSDVEQATVCLILVTLLLYASTLVNSTFYVLLFKQEILCLYISLLSIVGAAIVSLVAVINFELADHSITVNGDVELAFKLSNLSASFWLAAIGCVDALITTIVVILAIKANRDETRDDDEKSIISRSSSRLSVADNASIYSKEAASPDRLQLDFDHSNDSIADDKSITDRSLSWVSLRADDIPEPNQSASSSIADDISEYSLSESSRNADDFSESSQYSSSCDSSDDSDDSHFDLRFAKLKNLRQTDRQRPESSQGRARQQEVQPLRKSQSVPYLPHVEQIPKPDFTDDLARVQTDNITQSTYHDDDDLVADHPPPSALIIDRGHIRTVEPNANEEIDNTTPLKRAHSEILLTKARDELPEQDYIEIEDTVVDVEKKKKRSRPKFLRKRNPAKRKRIEMRRAENKMLKDTYSTTTKIPIYPPPLEELAKPAPWTISKNKKMRRGAEGPPQMPVSMIRALVKLGLYKQK